MAFGRRPLSPNQGIGLILLLDNYDSFTYNLVDYFAQLGVACDVRRNSEPINQLISEKYTSMVISPGSEDPSKAGNLMETLDYYANKGPVLGICLGHQAIGEYFGADLVKASAPMHGKISKIVCKEHHPLYRDIPKEHEVVRYNSLVLAKVKPPLSVTASTLEGEIMAIAHNKLPIWGVQYHPEAALSQHGLKTISNWVQVTNQ